MDSNGEATSNQEDGNKLARSAGRALVREVLIAALAGLGPRRGQSVVDMQAEQAAVCERLCYMTAQNLRGLAECALRMAGALKAGVKHSPAWPEPAQMFAWAFVLQFPPPRSSDYIPSVMRSRLGDAAMDGGWHVELFRHCRRGPPPPVGDYAQGQLRDDAAETRRRLERVIERCQHDHATREDRQFLAAWHRDKSEAEALVLSGRAARAAMVEGAAA